MLILVTYDVNTETENGKKRLRQVAKICIKYGQRVQNSVFECILDITQLRLLEYHLKQVMDTETDSIRFYNLGNHYHNKVEHYGIKAGYEAEGTLIV